MRLPTRGSLDRTADPDANLPIGKLPTTIYDYFNPRQVTGVAVPSPHTTAHPPGRAVCRVFVILQPLFF